MDHHGVVAPVDVPAVQRGARQRLEPLAEADPVHPAGPVDPPREPERDDADDGGDGGELRDREPVPGGRRPRDRLEEPRETTLGRQVEPLGGGGADRQDRERHPHHRRSLAGVARRVAPRLAEEREEQHPSQVERGEERGDRAQHVHGLAAGVLRDLQDGVLREEPRQGRDPGLRERPDQEGRERDGHEGAETPHPSQVLFIVHPVDHRARAQEQERLVEGVRDQEEHRDAVRAHPRGHEHEPELADRGVGEHAFDVLLRDGARRREHGRDDPHHEDDRQGDPG